MSGLTDIDEFYAVGEVLASERVVFIPRNRIPGYIQYFYHDDRIVCLPGYRNFLSCGNGCIPEGAYAGNNPTSSGL